MVRIDEVSKRYRSDSGEVEAIRRLSFELPEGAFAAVTGPSGCGKSTLLHLLACLDTPSSGAIHVHGRALHRMNEEERTHYRRRDVGIVFQFFNLMPTMTVEENVRLPLLLAGRPLGEARRAAERLLALVQLDHRSRHFASQLSGGEMQRTAIARALVHQPKLLLADEPTGNLDSANSRLILDILRELHEETHLTMILVTHSSEVAAAARHQIRLNDGQLESFQSPPAA